MDAIQRELLMQVTGLHEILQELIISVPMDRVLTEKVQKI